MFRDTIFVESDKNTFYFAAYSFKGPYRVTFQVFAFIII